MRRTFYLVLLSFSTLAFSQQQRERYVLASPVIGWDSLKTLISPKGPGEEGFISVHVQVDSTGAITDSIQTIGAGDVYSNLLRRSVRSTRWHPATHDGKPIKSLLVISLHFFLTDPPGQKRLIIEVEQEKHEHEK